MKKSRLFLGMVFAATLFVSCSDDDNDNDVEEPLDQSELILGEWNYISQTLNGEDIDFNDECQKENEYQIYTSDGVYHQTEFENITGNGCEQVASTVGTWSIEDSILNLNIGSDPEDHSALTILELSENTLKYQIMTDYDNDGVLDDYIGILSRRN